MRKKISIDELSNVSGGILRNVKTTNCPKCGCAEVNEVTVTEGCSEKKMWECNSCHHQFDK